MTDFNTRRSETFTRLARECRAYAARQEARAPGRMDHITKAPLAAAEAAERAAAAYAAGDKEAAIAARDEYIKIAGILGSNVGGIV
jgi:hypothetical protein